MGIPGGRISKAQETIRREKRLSRKEIRSKLVNAKRNLVLDEPARVEAVELTQSEKLKLWRLEKKKKMDEEKLKRRPPFRSFINVKHTGLSPYKNTYPGSLNPIRKIKKTDNFTNNAATSNNRIPTVAKQISENNAQPVVTRTTRQTVNKNNNNTNGALSKQESNKVAPAKPPLQPRNTRNAKKNPIITAPASKTVTEVEKKPLRVVQPSNKTIKSNATTKKTDRQVKPVNNKEIKGVSNIKTAVNNKKEVQRKNPFRENKENIIEKTDCACDSKKYFTRSRSRAGNTGPIQVISIQVTPAAASPATSTSSSNDDPANEPSNGPTFQRARLLEETTKLQILKEKWLNKTKENDLHLPESISDEILSVTGLTTLLITSKFEQFKSLIDDCSLQLNDSTKVQRIVPDDLDGFWEMMYLQVVQLHNKYANLERLMMNNWQEQKIRAQNKPKKSVIKTPLPRKSGRSRFQDFLNKKKEEKQNVIDKPSSSDNVSSLGELIAAAEQEDNGALNLSSLKSCLATPKAVKNLIAARRSRRSSLNIIMSMSGVGKFDISGTALSQSPKVEKRVMFAEDDE